MGQAKLRSDKSRINKRFLLALGTLRHFDSTLDNKMMAAEIITSLSYDTSHFFFFSSRRRHTRLQGDWSSDVCSSDLVPNLRSIWARLALLEDVPRHLYFFSPRTLRRLGEHAGLELRSLHHTTDLFGGDRKSVV